MSESATIEEIRAALLKAQTQAEPALADIKEAIDRLMLFISAADEGVQLPQERGKNGASLDGLNSLIVLLQELQVKMAALLIETMDTPKSLSFSPVKNYFPIIS